MRPVRSIDALIDFAGNVWDEAGRVVAKFDDATGHIVDEAGKFVGSFRGIEAIADSTGHILRGVIDNAGQFIDQPARQLAGLAAMAH